MNRLFVDTNIIIDLLSKRKGFYEDSQDFFSFALENNIELVVSALTFANAHYILSQQLKMPRIRQVLRKFKVMVDVAAFDDKILDLSLEEKFRDYEDGVQYYTAIESGCKIIITRNKKDFKESSLPVLNTKEFLKLIN